MFLKNKEKSRDCKMPCGKKYLNAKGLSEPVQIVPGYLDFAERQAESE